MTTVSWMTIKTVSEATVGALVTDEVERIGTCLPECLHNTIALNYLSFVNEVHTDDV